MALVEWQPVDLRSDPDEALYRGDPGDLVDAVGFVLALAGRPAWHARAACRGQGHAAWFPGRGGDSLDAARGVCAGCPVQAACLDAGLEERHGMWGGTSSRHNAAIFAAPPRDSPNSSSYARSGNLCAPHVTGDGEVMARELAQAGVDAFNRRDPDAMRKLYASDATVTSPDNPSPMSVEDMVGGIDAVLSSFPDVKLSLGSVVSEGDNVAFEVTWTGTHKGPLAMPDGSELDATGRTVSFMIAVMLETDEGVIVRERQYYDNLAILDQLGVA